MERLNNSRPVLRDLALIYIALAHSTDEQLDEVEVDAIAQRLHAWQAEVKEETVLSAIKDALEEYLQRDARQEVQAAVVNVREAIPQDLRQFIVDDLVGIAMADGRFIHEESSFIGEIAQAWGVHMTAPSDGESRPWSLLTQRGEDDGWTALHDLALIYLTLAHQTDDDLSTSEMEAIARKLNEWLPDAAEEAVLQIVQEAISVYAQGPDERVFTDSVASVRKYVPEHQRAALLADLHYVANADGVVLDEEAEMIGRLATAWEIDVQPES